MTVNPIKAKKTPMTPDSVQILFVDLQPGIVEHSKTNTPEALLRSAVALARIGMLFRVPMFASVVPPQGRRDGPAPELAPELAQALHGAPVLTRTMIPVFDDAPTRNAIAATGRHDLVICGLVTEVAVLLACFGAIRAGYEVHVPMDACGGLSTRTEDAACRRIESFDANTASVATLGAVLCPDLSTPQAGEMMSILRTIMT